MSTRSREDPVLCVADMNRFDLLDREIAGTFRDLRGESLVPTRSVLPLSSLRRPTIDDVFVLVAFVAFRR